MSKKLLLQVTIAENGSLSGAVSLADAMGMGDVDLVGVCMPAEWTAAGLSFAVSCDGTTFGPLHDKDGEVTIGSSVAVAGAVIALDPVRLLPALKVKVRSGTTALPIAQVAARVLGLVVRPIA